MEVSIFEVLFFLTLLVYTAPHIMVFGAVFGVKNALAACDRHPRKTLGGDRRFVLEILPPPRFLSALDIGRR